MSVEAATWIVRLCGIYLAIGLLLAIPFVVRGVGRIDPVARRGSRGFRLLILPGCIALWPLLMKRWMSGATEPPPECTAHRRAAREHTP